MQNKKPSAPIEIGEGGWIFFGTDKSERLTGGDGGDEIYGGHGHDHVLGGAGNDAVSGSQGQDHLYGNAGADTFIFDGDFDHDHVRDFDAAEGDTFLYVFYDPAQRDWTGDDILSHGEQVGSHTVLSLPGTDEMVTVMHTLLTDLTADLFTVRFYVEEPII